MRTPWGDTEDLRRARLAPGPQPNGRAATTEHQRRRIFAWMVATIARTRLLYAIAELCAQAGYRNLTVSALAAQAKTSRRTLYERYGGKDECFLACFEMVRARTLQTAMAAYARLLPDWPRALHAAIEAITRYFASEPALARLVAVEVLAAGPAAFQARDEAIRSFVSLIEAGYLHAPRAAPIAREAISFGVYAMIHRHLALGRPAAALPQLAPAACFLALAPFLGAARAVEIANETVTLKQRSRATRDAP